MTNRFSRVAEIALLAVYMAALAAVLGRHEPWVDEVRAWQVVRDSHGIGDLLAREHYELHPALWYLSLYAVDLMHGGIGGMQAAHWLFASAAAVILFRSPFPLWLRASLPASYVLFYEYGVVSRNYAPGVLFLLAACALSRDRSKGLFAAAAALFLAAQCNLFAWLIAGVFGVMLLGRSVVRLRARRDGPTARQTLGAACVLVAGLAISMAQMLPPRDFASPIERAPLSGMELIASLSRIARGLIAVPVPEVHFWNTSLIAASCGAAGAAALGIALAVLAGYLLRNRPFAFCFYALAMAVLTAASFVMETRAARHIDHYFIVLIMAMWLAEDRDGSETPLGRGRTALLASLAALQIVGAGIAVWYDWRLPFDQSGAAAACIRAAGLQDKPIFGYEDYNASAVGAYLGRPIYYPQSGRTETFVRQIQGRAPKLPPRQLASSLAGFIAAHPGGSVVVLSPACPVPRNNPRIRVLGEFGEPCITGITYTVVQILPGS